jgi:cytochrome P450
VKLRVAGSTPGWFNDDWIRRYITALAIAGSGTVARSTIHAMDRLIAHPLGLQEAQRCALELHSNGDSGAREHLSQIIYEALRYRPMLPLLARYCLRETVLAKGTGHARTIPASAMILAPPIAAMFDPEVFTNPSQFDSSRPLKNYIHFGVGPHNCFGKYIADIVMVEVIGSVLLLPNLRRASGLKGRVHHDGPAVASLRLRFDPEARGRLP